MKKLTLLIACLFIGFNAFSQDDAKKLLDEVSQKMGAYKNMSIGFSSKLINKEAGLLDETPIRGHIVLSGEKYFLDYLGNEFIFDGKQLVVINKEEQEITITKGDMEEEDGFIYPSKLITFYKEGYNFKMGKLKTISGRKIQFIELMPIDSKSAITKVLLGIDAKTKHIYNLKQIGKNGAETTFTIHKFKSNQKVPNILFSFDRKKYEKRGYLID